MRSVMKRNIATVDNVEVSKNGYSERSVAELLDALHKRLPTNNKWFATRFFFFFGIA